MCTTKIIFKNDVQLLNLNLSLPIITMVTRVGHEKKNSHTEMATKYSRVSCHEDSKNTQYVYIE